MVGREVIREEVADKDAHRAVRVDHGLHETWDPPSAAKAAFRDAQVGQYVHWDRMVV